MKECPVCQRCFDDGHVVCPEDQSNLVYSLPGPPEVDGKYRLVQLIGRGGMGAVYRAQHKALGKWVAIKTVSQDFASRDTTALERFRQEARASAAIHHPNVVGAVDFGVTADRVFYLVMEYVEGHGLNDIITQEGPLTPERSLKIMKQVCAGVAAAHRLGMIHRDLKPSNVMVIRPMSAPVSLEDMGFVLGDDTPALPSSGSYPAYPAAESDNEPNVKVLDFGLAKILNSEVLGDGPATLGTGVMGTPHYMSPEQCNGRMVDARSDIYSLGVVLFQMLTKEVPFKGDSFGAIISGHLMKNPPSLRSLNPFVSEAVENVVLRALSKDPANRQQSVAQLADELEAAVSRRTDVLVQAAVLFVHTQPGNCEVYVNNDFRGKTGPEGKLALRLDPGEYRIRFSAPGWNDLAKTVQMGTTEQQLSVQLIHKTVGVVSNRSGSLPSGGYATPFGTTGSIPVTNTRPAPVPVTTGRPGGPVSGPVHFESLQPNLFATFPVDAGLATVCTALALGGYLLTNTPSPDPLTEKLGSEFSMLPLLIGFAGVFGTIGAVVSMLLADYRFPHQSTPTLAFVFNASRILFGLAVILTTVAAPLGALAGRWEMPSVVWLAVRVLLIVSFSTLYARVRGRHRALIV